MKINLLCYSPAIPWKAMHFSVIDILCGRHKIQVYTIWVEGPYAVFAIISTSVLSSLPWAKRFLMVWQEPGLLQAWIDERACRTQIASTSACVFVSSHKCVPARSPPCVQHLLSACVLSLYLFCLWTYFSFFEIVFQLLNVCAHMCTWVQVSQKARRGRQMDLLELELHLVVGNPTWLSYKSGKSSSSLLSHFLSLEAFLL